VTEETSGEGDVVQPVGDTVPRVELYMTHTGKEVALTNDDTPANNGRVIAKGRPVPDRDTNTPDDVITCRDSSGDTGTPPAHTPETLT